MTLKKIVGIHQPNFLPWLGYFHKMVRSDEFVLLDNVQFSKNSIGNRSYIKRKDGYAAYLTVPVRLSKQSFKNYNETEIDFGPRWPEKGLNIVKDAYQKAPFFKTIYPFVRDIFQKQHLHIAALNMELIQFVRDYLDIHTPMILSSTLNLGDVNKSDLVLEINKQRHATTYLSGGGARAYNDENSFNANNINIIYTKFSIDDIYKAPDENKVFENLNVLHFMFNYEKPLIKELIYCPTTTAY